MPVNSRSAIDPPIDSIMASTAIDILGVSVHPLTVTGLHEQLTEVIERGDRAQVLHVNVHGLNLADEQPWLRDVLNQAEIVFCDGAGVILGARLLGHYIPERITYADWIWQLADFAVGRGYSLYFLGAKPGVARAAADRLLAHYPGLKIVGVQHGYFDQSVGHPENIAVVNQSTRHGRISSLWAWECRSRNGGCAITGPI